MKKKQLSASLDEEEKENYHEDNPFEFDAFASINRIAKILNYEVYSVLEHDEKKHNPFEMINKNISTDIKDFTKQLETLIKQNRASLKQLKQKAIKETEKERTQENITNALAEKEIEYLKQTVLNLEVKQLAESCVRVYSRRQVFRNKRKEYEYKMIFDESIRIPPLWLSEEEYLFLNKNREEVKAKTNNRNKYKGKRKVYPISAKKKDNDESNYGF